MKIKFSNVLHHQLFFQFFSEYWKNFQINSFFYSIKSIDKIPRTFITYSVKSIVESIFSLFTTKRKSKSWIVNESSENQFKKFECVTLFKKKAIDQYYWKKSVIVPPKFNNHEKKPLDESKKEKKIVTARSRNRP